VNLQTGPGKRALAYGRDPYFPGWTDTLQLNYGNSALQEEMQQVLLTIAAQCDGARCDMAMLLLPEIFKRTWGIPCQPFWPDAIRLVKAVHPRFTFMAEVYWDLEWQLQQQGFDYTYDKRLYDRLRQGAARAVRDHLRAGLDYQEKSARFLENHDEPRAASILPPEIHQAAAVITFLSPCLRFFHQGQLEGYTRKIPVQLCRAPAEIPDPRLQDFYHRLLACLRLPPLRDGDWQMLEPLPAAAGNPTWDGIIAYAWSDQQGNSLLVLVNYSSAQAQCNLKLPFEKLDRVEALLSSPNCIDRHDLQIDDDHPILLVDLPPWAYRLYALNRAP